MYYKDKQNSVLKVKKNLYGEIYSNYNYFI